MEIIKANFGLYALTDQHIAIPNGIATNRRPDLTIKTTTPTYIIELLGGVHNWEEDQPRQRRDIEKRSDYALLGKEYKVIELYEKIDSYAEERIIKELYDSGLPVNEDEAQRYRNRKVTRYAL